VKRDESRSETDFGALAGLTSLGPHAKTAQNCAISKPKLELSVIFQLDNGGEGVRLTYISGRSLLATKVAIKPSKLDIVKHMAFQIVRLRFYKATLFSGNGFGNGLDNAKETQPCIDPVTG